MLSAANTVHALTKSKHLLPRRNSCEKTDSLPDTQCLKAIIKYKKFCGK